ncbi:MULTISPECIES: type IV pilin protein [Nocardioides]|uniref:Type IV pilin protein n=1 Tax=Nocardioides vastitatis TaxID=2568655 RepID=A0ABW0ZFW3_9ACTN|nr:prepilin-type N-terminal cleavage/methylation domain-containing protein [Nocardioides sp.]THI96551.1 prepilin-type N-terminal cleavage/methylation domain-containing protein [Nocardioides sp.]
MLRNALSRARNVRRDEGGFTLIELLIVIVILGILAAIVAFSVRGIVDRGGVSACKAEVKTVATAEEAHYAKNGSYATIANLQSGGFLRAGTPEYVASADAANGSLTMVADAPCSAG